MDNWILNYAGCVTELSRLLGLRFIWDGGEYKSVGARTPIGEAILMVGVFNNEHDFARRNVEIAKLSMLVKHLKTIERHDKELLKKFKRKIRDTSKEQGTYFGVRMEIMIAASLIQKGINFTKTERPDFTIEEYEVYLECTSSHKLDDSTTSLTDKIRSAILEKSKKEYCNSSTVLCMDITNIAATNEESENKLLASKDGLKRIVEQILIDTNSSYGSFLIFSYFMDLTNTFYSGYWRIDNETSVPALTVFLDKYYPIGEFRTGAGWAPKAG